MKSGCAPNVAKTFLLSSRTESDWADSLFSRTATKNQTWFCGRTAMWSPEVSSQNPSRFSRVKHGLQSSRRAGRLRGELQVARNGQVAQVFGQLVFMSLVFVECLSGLAAVRGAGLYK